MRVERNILYWFQRLRLVAFSNETDKLFVDLND